MTAVKTAAVMPVGPNCVPEFIEDSLTSITQFLPGCRLIVVDDSGKNLGRVVGDRFGATVITTPQRGKGGAMYLNLSEAFSVALQERFDLLLRIDTDALVTGSDFAGVASDMFNNNPRLACVGSLAQRSETVARVAIRRHFTRPRLVVRDPIRAMRALALSRLAERQGHHVGTYVFGGICVYSWSGVAGLRDAGLLGRREFPKFGMSEDHLFGLLIGAAGLHMARLETPERNFMGTSWRSLPAAPGELVEKGFDLVHSVRSWAAMSEQEIRAEFATLRSGRV